MYEGGKGVRKDNREAAKWYRFAADSGNAKAATRLVDMNKGGRGFSRDNKPVAKCLQKEDSIANGRVDASGKMASESCSTGYNKISLN